MDEDRTMALGDMAGHLIRRLHQVSTQVFLREAQAAGYDLTPVQFAALDALRSHPGIDQGQLSALIAYDRATIGGVVDRLEQKGFVRRAISRHDRRAREVSLTPEGRRVFDEMLPVVRRLQADILAPLDDAERAQFMELARKALAGRAD